MRQLPASTYAALKTATRHLVDEAGGIDAAGASTRVGRATMAQYYSRDERNAAVYAPLDVIADLEAATGVPTITRHLARLAGYELVPALAKDAEAVAPSDAVRAALMMGASLSVGVGRYQQLAIEAAEDGNISPAELRELEEALYKLSRVTQSAHDTVVRLRQNANPGAGKITVVGKDGAA